jgi:hypothetical protein
MPQNPVIHIYTLLLISSCPICGLFILDSPVQIATYSLFNHPAANATLQLFPHLTGSIIKIFINPLLSEGTFKLPTSPSLLSLQSALRSLPVESLAAYS